MTPPRVVALGLLLACSTAAHAILVESQFVGGGDVAGASTYCWKEGAPVPTPEVERTIHAAVDKWMTAKGYRLTECEAELYVVANSKKDESFPGGEVKIEISMAGSDRVTWRGTATGVVVANKIKKRQQMANLAIKKMFKQFPRARSAR